ncbi:MAG: type 4a pilus biogenesis protein PilO [Aeromonadaceae bacterium]|nr:type 4a pilus biogenesis protein PilO [Aeromonadaceae bacterium]
MNLQELNELDFNDIGVWPWPVKIAMVVIIFVLISVGGYVYFIADSIAALDTSRNKETELKVQFEMKAALASNLEAYKQQMVELEGLLQAQLRQLPNKNEVAGLLDDISFIAMDNGLKLLRINWEPEIQHEFSTELPMRIELSGSYSQLGKFSSDVAALPRIVVLDSFTTVREKESGDLLMSMLAKTYRYNENNGKAKTAKAKGRN